MALIVETNIAANLAVNVDKTEYKVTVYSAVLAVLEGVVVAEVLLLTDLHRRYPRASIVGHHDLNPQKACPCIKDVAREYKDLQPH